MDERTKKLIDTYNTQGPLSMEQIGGVIASTPSNQPISSQTLADVKPLSIPATPVSTTAEGITGAAQALGETVKASEIQQAADAKEAAALQAKQESKTGLLSKMQELIGVQQSRPELEAQAGIEKKSASYNTALTNLEASQRAQTNELRALESANMTDAGRAAAQRDINRKYAFEQADLSLILSVANRDLSSAQAMVDRKIQLALEPLQTQLEFSKLFYEDNKADFDKAEQRAFENRIRDNERAYDEAKSFETQRGQLQLSAASQGADPSIIQAIGRAKNLQEAIQAAGQYSGDILDRQIKKQQLVNAQREGEKLLNEVEASKPLTGEFAGIINGAAGLVPNTKRQTVKTNIASAISQQNYPLAYAEVANAVSDGLTGTNKTTFDDARTDIGVMSGMRKAIQDYVNAGGNVGFLKGTSDELAKKFGQLAVDPKFAALGTQLQREFQAYRLAMTGAAFTPEESAEYAKVNPRTNASLDLNLATIDGALAQLTNRVTSTVNARIPDAQKIYDLAFAKEDQTESQTAVGDTQVVNGVRYVKASDGLYYPENQPSTQSNTQTTTPTYQSLNTNNAFGNFGSLFKFE